MTQKHDGKLRDGEWLKVADESPPGPQQAPPGGCPVAPLHRGGGQDSVNFFAYYVREDAGCTLSTHAVQHLKIECT